MALKPLESNVAVPSAVMEHSATLDITFGGLPECEADIGSLIGNLFLVSGVMVPLKPSFA